MRVRLQVTERVERDGTERNRTGLDGIGVVMEIKWAGEDAVCSAAVGWGGIGQGRTVWDLLGGGLEMRCSVMRERGVMCIVGSRDRPAAAVELG